MFNLEKSIQDWLRTFRKHRAYDEASFYEMELHLRDHIEDLINEGYDPKEAFEKATLEFGDITQVAKEEYWTQKRKQTIRTFLYATLFKNYYKTSIRGMMRNPLSSLINVFGLSAAIGVCIFTYGFAQWTYRTDQFHENKHQVFQATFFAEREGKLQQNGKSPMPLAQMLKQDFPQIDAVCRVQNSNAVVKYEEHVFHERLTFADPSYLSLFTFPLKAGSIHSLKDVNNVILSEGKAKKYFGDTNPIGQTILIRFSDDRSKTFVVSGVAKKFPASLSFNFHFLIHFDNMKLADPSYDENDWGSFVEATFIYTQDTTGVNLITQQMDGYKALQNKSERDWKVESFVLEPLATLHKRSANIRNAFSISSDEGYVAIVFLSLTGVFLLALACFNYINISIVSASKRLKEIGIRKTIGANRRIVIVQFLSENLIATSLALSIGVLFGVYLFIPWFESLFYFDMGFRWTDLTLWIYIPLILFVTALSSGLYPAFYISRFPVTGILKKAVKFGRKNSLTRVILGFQLVLACLFITCAITFTRNAEYLANRNWGYNEDLALYTQVPDLPAYSQLEAMMLQERDVSSVSGSVHHLGRSSLSTVIQLPNEDHEAEQLAVDATYFSTMGISLLDGRFFQENHEQDKKAIVINEVFAQDILDESAIGKVVKIDSNRYTVIGVVKDFHTYDFESKVEPTFFKLAEQEDFKYLSLKVTDGKQREVYKALQENWITLFPETPFPGGYQEDVWGMYFVEVGIHGKVWRGIATIAILLAGLGLYGLVTLNVSGRVREFSIRKVLGADVRNLAGNITKQYVLLFIIALTIAAPLSYFLISFIFDFAYTYHIPIDLSGVTLAVFILIGILAVVVISQLNRVSKSNPVEGLKVD